MRFQLILLFLFPISLTAQERTAGGSLATEASWTALQNMITATNGNVTILRTDVNAMKACGAQRKIWTGTQCLDAASVDSIVLCGQQGRIYNGSGCILPATPAATPEYRWTIYGKDSNRWSATGTVQRLGAKCSSPGQMGRMDDDQECGTDNNPKKCWTTLRCE